MRLSLAILIFLLSFSSCRKHNSNKELKNIFKLIEGEWNLKEYHYSSWSYNPNGSFTRKVDVVDGVKTIINSHTAYMFSEIDTTIYFYQLKLDFNDYTIRHILEYSSEEIVKENGQNEVISTKEHKSDWSEMQVDSIRFNFPEGLMSYNSSENKLTFKYFSSTSTLSTIGNGSSEYIFIRP